MAVGINNRIRNGQSSNKREEILEVASSLFRHQGFEGTSMQDIASAVGMLKGSIYYHFSSKEEILYEVVCKGVNWLLVGTEPILKSDQDPRQKLRLLLERHARHLMVNNDSIVIFSQESNKLSPQHRLIYVSKRDSYEGALVQILEEGIEGGYFPKVEVNLTVLAILGMLNWLIQWYNPRGLREPDYIAAYLASLVCDLMLGQGRAGSVIFREEEVRFHRS